MGAARSRPVVLDAGALIAFGALRGLRRTADIVDASVVLLAKRHDAVVVTSDPDDLRKLDDSIELITC